MPRLLNDPQIEQVLRSLSSGGQIADTQGIRQYIGSQLDIGKNVGDISSGIANQRGKTGASVVDEFNPNTISQFGAYGTGNEAGFLKSAQSLFDPLKQASNAKLDASRRLNANDFSSLETRLKERGANQQEGLRQDLTNRGFLRSGEQVGTGERIAKQTTEDINRADIQRAISDADAVLQNASYNVDINKQIGATARENQQYDQTKQDNSFARGLEQQGFDTRNLKDVAGIYNAFTSANEVVPPWLYEELRKTAKTQGGYNG